MGKPAYIVLITMPQRSHLSHSGHIFPHSDKKKKLEITYVYKFVVRMYTVGMFSFSSLGSKNKGRITAFGGHAPFLVDEYGHIGKVYQESLNGFSLKCFINMNAFKKKKKKDIHHMNRNFL